MKKTIGVIAIAALMGSLSASATVILFDDFTVAGGAGSINDGIGVTRQTTGTQTSTYTVSGTASNTMGVVVDDFVNGGTARLTGIYDSGNTILLDMDTNFGSELAGQEWKLDYLTVGFPGGNYNGGWTGFGVNSATRPDASPFGEFGAIMRADGAYTVFSGGAVVGSGTMLQSPYASVFQIITEFDELAQTATLSYNAFALGDFSFLGSETLGTYTTSFTDPDRNIQFQTFADSMTAPENITTYVENVLIETIPEPATLGMVALLGGGILWIRKRFTI